ncbi:FAD-dependent oxidoreductase [Chloroflexota bacterium]
MARVVVIGAGISGCGAALAARKTGAQVTLVERTDMLVGVAVRAGETNGNGNFVAQQELRFLGGGEIFDALESIKLHDNVVFPDAADHSFLYNAGLVEPVIKKIVAGAGIELILGNRALDVEKADSRILAVKLDDGRLVEGDSFVDCTGSRGGIKVCTKYGKGCVMCLVRCIAFGDRVGIVDKAGGKLYHRVRPDGTPGFLNAAVTVFKDTLSPELKARVEKEGLVKIPLPKELIDYSKGEVMSSGRSREFLENLIVSDIGPIAKCSGITYITQAELRQAPGFENCQLEDPRSGIYNHVSHVSVAFRDDAMRAEGFDNLFCGGEKAGHGSVDAAISTGYLAGHNAARGAFQRELLVLPLSLALGDYIAYANKRFRTKEGRTRGYFMSWGEYWERMQKLGLYTDDLGEIKSRVEKAGLTGILSRNLT